LSAKPMMGSSNDNRVSESVIKRGDRVKVRDASHHLYGKTGTVKTANSIESRNSGKASHIIMVDGGLYRIATNAIGKLHTEEFLADASNPELKKFTGGGKEGGGIKRKYLGALRGKTATGSRAHPIEIDPVMTTDSDINKVVR